VNRPEHYLQCLLGYVYDTRRHGVTYVHAPVRQAVMSWQGATATINGRLVRLTYGSYGRSIQAGGHKYKAWARYCDDGKPVPTAVLRAFPLIPAGGAL
jgi:hypothetical protein